MMKILETERLILKPFTEADAPQIFELDSNSLVHRYLGNKPLTNFEQAKEVIQGILLQYKENGLGRHATYEKKSGEFIGWTGLKWETGEWSDFNYYDLGYRLLPKFWGKGYATEASVESLRYGFEELKLPSIYGAADVENVNSNRVLQKCGLQFENVFEYDGATHNWYGISRKDYNLLKAK